LPSESSKALVGSWIIVIREEGALARAKFKSMKKHEMWDALGAQEKVTSDCNHKMSRHPSDEAVFVCLSMVVTYLTRETYISSNI